MPLDPPKEQFHRPTRLVDLSDGKCGQLEVVGEEYEALVGFSAST
jgi:hypothetical protein